MRIRERENEDEAPINLMPLIDMVFLLLIFFLVATTISQEERDLSLTLPELSEPRALSDVPKQMIINIRPNGDFRIDKQILDATQLQAALHNYVDRRPDAEVLIRADEQSIHRYFADVMAMCHAAGISEPRVAFLPPPKQPS